MTYEIEFSSKAEKQFKKLETSVQSRLARKIDNLSTEPKPAGYTKLSGEQDIYRIRAGDFRVVYTIKKTKLVVLILKIGHRREIYR
jgi:mRNA interferase RelE/StbE